MIIGENEIYTTKELSGILKISMPTVKRMLKDGRLTSTRIGRQHRFLGRDILDLMRAQRDLSRPRLRPVRNPPPVQPFVMEAAFAPEQQPVLYEPPPRAPWPNAIPYPEPSPLHKPRSAGMIGRSLGADILDDDGDVLFPSGTVITDEIIREAGKRRKLIELYGAIENR